MKPQRVIFASDLNANYIQFWPLTRAIWKHTTGLKTTLIFVAPHGTPINHLEDVVYFEPPSALPTCFVAQHIRILAPLLFPNEICIVADIDTMMISKTFFTQYLSPIPDNRMAILNRYPADIGRPSMCYHVAKGSIFGELLKCTSFGGSTTKLKEWHGAFGGQWATDELIMHKMCAQHASRCTVVYTPHLWSGSNILCISHYRGMTYSLAKLGQYIELEPSYPYLMHKNMIDNLVHKLLPRLGSLITPVQKGISKTNRHPIKKKSSALTASINKVSTKSKKHTTLQNRRVVH